jgi:hypothetical protein
LGASEAAWIEDVASEQGPNRCVYPGNKTSVRPVSGAGAHPLSGRYHQFDERSKQRSVAPERWLVRMRTATKSGLWVIPKILHWTDRSTSTTRRTRALKNMDIYRWRHSSLLSFKQVASCHSVIFEISLQVGNNRRIFCILDHPWGVVGDTASGNSVETGMARL